MRFLVILFSFSIIGCGLFTPLPSPTSVQQRLANFSDLPNSPINSKVEIRWNQYQVPYIIAENDLDSAFALGLIHAHLRLGQMEMIKRIAYGRISEMAGPLTVDIDKFIRTIGYSRHAKKIIAAMPEESYLWLEKFTHGVNFYKDNCKELPHEYSFLAMENEPWTMEDSITAGRLFGTDVNWLSFINLLPIREGKVWSKVRDKIKAIEDTAQPSFFANLPDNEKSQILQSIFLGLSKSGSNSFAISPQRSKSGHAIIANDPHLGMILPNVWLIVGLKSPSYHMVGMMAPGLPVFGFGRNKHLAWGGTNMRSWSTDLVNITGLAEEKIQKEKHNIGVRLWLDESFEVPITPYGPEVSELELLPYKGSQRLAFRWMGHEASDEVTALLKASQARNGQELRQALNTFSLPGQNIIFADHEGNIGQILATWVPKRNNNFPENLWTEMEESDRSWQSFSKAMELPYIMVPKEKGFIVSANNRPVNVSKPPVTWFSSADTRMVRITQLLTEKPKHSWQDLAKMQQDTYSITSVILRDYVNNIVQELSLSSSRQKLWQEISQWDGRYEVNSRGAFLFEVFISELMEKTFSALDQETEYAIWKRGAYLKKITVEKLSQLSPAEAQKIVLDSLQVVAKHSNNKKTWGDIHRWQVQHILGFAPLVGSAYQIDDIPAAGSKATILKTGHPHTADKHRVTYGSQSRHISDLSDLDENYFILLGGQDGWIRSQNFADQISLWEHGRFIKMPLRVSEVPKYFPFETSLSK